MTINIYPWHDLLYQQLTQAFLNGRGHHALLFKTESGLGTSQLIRYFAQWLLCIDPQGAHYCGRCKSCLLYQSGNHPDFYCVESIDDKEIGIDQIRDLTAKLQQFAQQDGNIVIYFPRASRLTEAAANALLKTLEEPHERVYFLLEAPLQSAMLATIQSRCQVWLVHTPEHLQAMQWLVQHCPEFSVDDIAIALRLCHGRPLSCQIFLESDCLAHRQQCLESVWQFFQTSDVWALFSTLFPHRQSKESNKAQEQEALLQQLDWLDGFFSDALRSKMGIASGWQNPDWSVRIGKLAVRLSAQKLLAALQQLQQLQRDLREINAVNQELLVMDYLTKLLLEIFER